MLEGPVAPDEFYRGYAAGLGIGNAGAYAVAMAALDEADDDARNNLFNIGFCYGGYWTLRRGIANYGRFSPAKLEASIGRFESARDGLRACLPAAATPEGRRYLEFLDNRISCTVLHLRSFLKMSELQALFAGRTPPALTEPDRRRVRETCDAALDLRLELHLLLGQTELLEVSVEPENDRCCRRLIDLPALKIHDPVLKHIDPSDGVGSSHPVQFRDHLTQGSSFSIQFDRDSVLKLQTE
jgi:hypothetical protein